MLANLFSILRIVLVPFLLYSLRHDAATVSAATVALILLAAFTDFADGYLARRLHQVSQLGRILDPVADKIFLAAVVAALVAWRDFPPWLLAMLVIRDAGILLAGLFILRSRKQVLPANRSGKYTTACMFAAVLCHIVGVPAVAREVLNGAAALLLLASSLSYVSTLRRILTTAPVERLGEEGRAGKRKAG